MNPQKSSTLTKAERTAQAREKARLIREAENRRRKRNSWLIRGGVIVVALAVVLVVAIVVITTIRSNAPIPDAGPAPAHVTSNGGVTLGKDGTVVSQEGAEKEVNRQTLGAEPTKAPTTIDDPKSLALLAGAPDKPVPIVIYADFICPICHEFEKATAPLLEQLAREGKVTYEYRLLGLLDRNSSTNYSSRAAAASYCVANAAPDKYSEYVSKLFADQPQEGGAGLSNNDLKQRAHALGVNIDSCIDDKTYRPYVAYQTQRAFSKGVGGTPMIYVNGSAYTWKTADFSDFKGVIDVALQSHSQLHESSDSQENQGAIVPKT